MPHLKKRKMTNKIKDGSKVKVHYRGTFEDGTEFDSSHSRGEPISFEVGSGQLISGFDTAVRDMTIGESKKVSITPENGYGERNSEAIQKFPLDSFPEGFNPEEGVAVYGKNALGQEVMAMIESFDSESVTLDFNHPMAGKNLNFEIELIEVE